MQAGDADASGGLSQDEFYDLIVSMDGYAGDAASYAELELLYKVTHKSLACYCTVLGGGEDCCVGESAEINVAVLSDEEAIANGTAEQYEKEVCETISWALGMEADGGAEVASTEAPQETTEAPEETTEAPEETTAAPEATTGATVDVATTGATEAGPTTTPASGELPLTTTEAPVRFPFR